MKFFYIAITCIALLSANHAVANVDLCVDEKINAHRAEVGPDAMIHYAMLEEWKEECGGGPGDYFGRDDSEPHFNTQQDKPNFSLEAKETWHEIFGSWVNGLHFQALDDRIVITDMVINRGNCGFNTDRLPLTLGFGNTARVGIHCPVSNVIEVQIEANTGSWVFNFQ